MSPSTNTRSVPTTLSIVPSTSYFVKKTDLDNTNNTNNTIFAKLIDKFDNQDENIKALFTK